GRLQVYPSPLRPGETATVKALTSGDAAGRLLVFDARGRTVRMLRPSSRNGTVTASWDGYDGRGEPAPAGVYFLRWEDGTRRASGKVLVTR
nr:T9SS type A sorting domain-containing protein [bacterium]